MLTRKLTHLEAHAIAHRLRQAGEVVAGVVEELMGMEASAPTLGEKHTDEKAAFEAWWNANETWPVAAKNLAFLAWTTRANKPQPQTAEPKGLTDEQRDAWMENAGYKVHSKDSHVGTAWDFTFPGKTGMDNRHYRSEAAARAAAIAHFEEAVSRARALLAKGE